MKGNQPRTLQAVETWFTEQAFDERHGRLTWSLRVCVFAPTELNVLEEWPGVQSILMVESIRMVKPRGVITTEKRFFLSSLPSEDEQQIAAIRQHWRIENSLHWVVSVTFREDTSQVREQHARHNLAQLSKNHHQSDTPQYQYRQRPKQAKTSRLG